MPPLYTFEQQRAEGDCGIACLAMFIGRSYEDVLAAASASEFDVQIHRRGIYLTQIIRIAKRFGVTLRRQKTFQPDEVAGLLSVTLRSTAFERPDHIVILHEGLILEMAYQQVWDYEDFIREHKAKIGTLLVGAS
jgi:ABC-type bacteriocin/lantibiotic exporter with double-glycine peptidase domain